MKRHVKLHLGPNCATDDTEVLIDGVDLTSGTRSIRVDAQAGEPTVVTLAIPTLLVGLDAGQAVVQLHSEQAKLLETLGWLPPSAAADLLYEAWTVIANVGVHKGGWDYQHPEWVEAATRWRDKWHTTLPASDGCAIGLDGTCACDSPTPASEDSYVPDKPYTVGEDQADG